MKFFNSNEMDWANTTLPIVKLVEAYDLARKPNVNREKAQQMFEEVMKECRYRLKYMKEVNRNEKHIIKQSL